MEVTSDGERLIKAWLGAQESVQRAKSNLNGAECDLSNTQEALAKWLIPEDAKPGEKFSVWFGDSLIQVEIPSPGDHSTRKKVTVRKRGRSISLAA